MQTALAMSGPSCGQLAARSSKSTHTCSYRGLNSRMHASKPAFLTGTPLMVRAPRGTTPASASASRSVMPVQASMLGRLGRVVRSYTFFYSDSAVRELEDPIKMLDQAVNDMQGDLVKMRQAAAQVMAAQAQMEQRYRAAQGASDDWKRRAEWALRKGDEDLAREALQRRKTYETAVQTLKAQLEQHSKATKTLRSNILALEGKVTEALSKKETLKARAMSAQATKMLNEEISSLVGGLRSSSNSSVGAFARMEAKVEALEAEAEAAGQLPGFAGDALEARFALLEGGASGVEDELLKLKTDMLASGALLEGRTTAKPRAYESMPNFQGSTRVDIAWP